MDRAFFMGLDAILKFGLFFGLTVTSIKKRDSGLTRNATTS